MGLDSNVPLFSKIVLCFNCGCGLFFAMFGYFWNPMFLVMAANMFTFGENMVFGNPHKSLTVEDATSMFEAAIASVTDEDKNRVAHNFLFAVTMKLRAECSFFLVTGLVCMYALRCPLKERRLLHVFLAIFGTIIMTIDISHASPVQWFGYNHFNNFIGAFIGVSFGACFLFVNYCSWVVVLYFPKDADKIQ